MFTTLVSHIRNQGKHFIIQVTQFIFDILVSYSILQFFTEKQTLWL